MISRITHKILDIIHFLNKLTPAKIINFFYVFTGFYIARITRKPVMTGQPVSIAFEPTTSCNLRCPECVSGLRSFTRPTGMLDARFFRETIQQVKNSLINLTFYFQGEPFLNPEFYEMVSLTNRYRIYSYTSTNGHYLSPENARKVIKSGLDRIIISVDNFEPEAYSKYRAGGNIETVVSGIKNLVKARKELKSRKPYIILQFLVNKDNETILDQLRKEAYRLGADKAVFKTMQIYHQESGDKFIPVDENLTRYAKMKDGKYKIRSRLFNHCWKMWHSCVITWDGIVVPCCFDKDADHRLGTLKERSFADIWKSKEYENFRHLILKSRSSVDMCTNCTEGTRVWI